MGCGSSNADGRRASSSSKKSAIIAPLPTINVTFGADVKMAEHPHTKVIFLFGGPGSGKGRIVGCLQSMFGMKLISSEAIILKYLPKRVAHVVDISSTDEIADLTRKEPHHVQLDWVLRLMQHIVESDPEQIFLVDMVPNLKWLIRNGCLVKECTKELEAFEDKTPISFAIHLSLGEDSLSKTLDYSHHNSNLPPGATVADDADSSKAKRRFLMQEKAAQPFLDYFQAKDKVVSVDVSSGHSVAIWEKVHEVCTSMQLHAWRPVDSVLVFAMESMVVGKLNLADCGMNVITLKDICPDPTAPVESLMETLSRHIDSLADTSHYFVIDPTSTTLATATMSDSHRRAIVFADVRVCGGNDIEECVDKFSHRLNALIGSSPYFRAVCSSDDETLLFPSYCDSNFCQQIALCMADKHLSKR